MNNFSTNSNSIALLLLSVFFVMDLSAQTVELELPVIQDATVNSRYPAANYGDLGDFIAMSWETNADSMILRSLIEFDASQVPAGAVIEEAWISLYSSDGSENPTHFGDNEARICQLPTGWDASTVTWDNQPQPSPESEVLLDKTLNPWQDFEHIDITELVKSILSEEEGVIGLSLLFFALHLYGTQTEILKRQADALEVKRVRDARRNEGRS